MLNRSEPPKGIEIKGIEFPNIEQTVLPNGCRYLYYNGGTEDICRVDLILNAGSRYQNQPLLARSAIELMPEGAGGISSSALANHFDFYGSFLDFSYTPDYARVTAYSLTKYLPQTLEMLERVVKLPDYNSHEVRTWKGKGKQNLTVQMEKTYTLARQHFMRSLYGNNHPYGFSAQPNHFNSITSAKTKAFHAGHFGSAGCRILLSGRIGDAQHKLIAQAFGAEGWGAKNGIHTPIPESNPDGKRLVFVEKPQALQSAIQVGRKLFPRTHPDYPGMAVLMTLLGGYFGSRLMTNLREDKGYTYGVSSSTNFFEGGGYLSISTEVGANHTGAALKEIFREIERLRTEEVGREELELVRNYLLGQILRNFNGPFAVANSVIGLMYYNSLDFEYFERTHQGVLGVTPNQIYNLAQKWLDPELMVQCVAGSENPFS